MTATFKRITFTIAYPDDRMDGAGTVREWLRMQGYYVTGSFEVVDLTADESESVIRGMEERKERREKG